MIFPFFVEEIAPVRDRGAPAGDGPVEDFVCSFRDSLPFIRGEGMNPAPRVHAGVMEDLTGIDIADTRYAALIYKERFYRERAVLGHFL